MALNFVELWKNGQYDEISLDAVTGSLARAFVNSLDVTSGHPVRQDFVEIQSKYGQHAEIYI